jgi:hypothetical protein
MNLRPIGICVLIAVSLIATTTASIAQGRRRSKDRQQTTAPVFTSAASRVSAEIAKGKLNTAESKPGDTVTLKLQDDLKANGQIVLKKGTAFTGVVRTVKRAEASNAQSMLEVEWLVPDSESKVARNVSVAMQSVTQANPVLKKEQESATDDHLAPGPASPVTAAFPRTVQTNHALLSMPSVEAVDSRTGAEIEAELGGPSASPLYKIGRGQLTTGGSQQSVDFYSHLANDTVITSSSKDFEISSGALVQLLVGVNR